MNCDLISRLVLDFRAHEHNLVDKWLTIKAWVDIFTKYYGLTSAIKSSKQQLIKSVQLLGPVTMPTNDSNDTNIHFHAARLQSKRIIFM